MRRYVPDFAGRQSTHPSDTLNRLDAVVKGMDGKRLKYSELPQTD